MMVLVVLAALLMGSSLGQGARLGAAAICRLHASESCRFRHSWQRHVSVPFAAPGHPGGGGHSREGAELVPQVRLVMEAAVGPDARPVDAPTDTRGRHRGVETLQAHMPLGG